MTQMMEKAAVQSRLIQLKLVIFLFFGGNFFPTANWEFKFFYSNFFRNVFSTTMFKCLFANTHGAVGLQSK